MCLYYSANVIANGGAVGFIRGDPVLHLLDDINALKPNGLPVVPRVANRLYDRILAEVANARPLRQRIFHHALNVKLDNWRKYKRITHPVYDRLIFNKIKAKLGGNVRFCVTGSAPINDNVSLHSYI